MTENKKYYTPSLEEFHVGFEYESLQDNRQPEKDNSWCKLALTWDDENFMKYYNNNVSTDYRVKYLDQEDIIELGWTEEKDSPDGRFSILKDDIHYYLIKYGHNHKYEIRCMHPSYKYGSFLGTIKNKSELRKVMQMVGINN